MDRDKDQKDEQEMSHWEMMLDLYGVPSGHASLADQSPSCEDTPGPQLVELALSHSGSLSTNPFAMMMRNQPSPVCCSSTHVDIGYADAIPVTLDPLILPLNLESQNSFADIQSSEDKPSAIQNSRSFRDLFLFNPSEEVVRMRQTNSLQPALLPYACQLDRERSIRSFIADNNQNPSGSNINFETIDSQFNPTQYSTTSTTRVNSVVFDPLGITNLHSDANVVTVGGSTTSQRGMSAEMLNLAELCSTISQPSRTACLRHLVLPEGPRISPLPDNQMFTERRNCPISRKISFWEEMMVKKSNPDIDSLAQPIACDDIINKIDVDSNKQKPVNRKGNIRRCSVYKLPPPPEFNHRRKQTYVNPIAQPANINPSTLTLVDHSNSKPVNSFSNDVDLNVFSSDTSITKINAMGNEIQENKSEDTHKSDLFDSLSNCTLKEAHQCVQSPSYAKSMELINKPSENAKQTMNLASHLEKYESEVNVNNLQKNSYLNEYCLSLDNEDEYSSMDDSTLKRRFKDRINDTDSGYISKRESDISVNKKNKKSLKKYIKNKYKSIKANFQLKHKRTKYESIINLGNYSDCDD